MASQNICLDAFVTPTSETPGGATAGIGQSLARIIGKFRAWREMQANIRHLRQMSDRQLRDIGIDRYDLPPNIQEMLATSHGTQGLLSLFPHSVVAGVGYTHRRVCD